MNSIYICFVFFSSFEIAARLNKKQKCIKDEWMGTEINEPRLGRNACVYYYYTTPIHRGEQEGKNVEANEIFLKPQLLFFAVTLNNNGHSSLIIYNGYTANIS